MFGNAQGNVIDLGAGNDLVFGRGGDDELHGGPGEDIAQFSGSRVFYTVTEVSPTRLKVVSVAEGTDQLYEIEILRFADGDYVWNAQQHMLVRNSSPMFPAGSVAVSILGGLPFSGSIGTATDVDGDDLSYSLLAAPIHGIASVAANGDLLYLTDPGFNGADSLVVLVSDGHGGTDSATLNITVTPLSETPPAPDDWSILSTSGFVGTVGGSGKVFGTGGLQDVTVADVAGTVVFDGSYNQGGDIVRLHGNADTWYVKQVGSLALFTDGDTFVQIPAGTTGMTVAFDDGVRLLVIDLIAGAITIGDQAIGTSFAQV